MTGAAIRNGPHLIGSNRRLLHTWFAVIPGWDVAGAVGQVGLDIPEFSECDEVIAYARRDMVYHGTREELACVPARALAHKSAAMDCD